MADDAAERWLIRREGSKVVGPVTTELVVRGLMAGKIPLDCMVQRRGESKWVRLAEIDAFHDATQATTVMAVARSSAAEAATTMMERPPDMDDSGPEIPDESLEALGRAWHAPEWMVMFPGDKDMRGPYTLSEVKRRVEERQIQGAQVCRMRTFDWMTVDEAFEQAGEPPLLLPSSAKIKAASAVSSVPPAPSSSSPSSADDPRKPIDWKAPLFRVMHVGELQGPTSLEQIERALRHGRLKEDDEISLLEGPAWLPLGPFVEDARKRKMQDKTVIVARRLGSDPSEAPLGIMLPRRKWGTYVVLAAIIAAFLAAFLFKALRTGASH